MSDTDAPIKHAPEVELEFSKLGEMRRALSALENTLGGQLRLDNPECVGSERRQLKARIKDLPKFRREVRRTFIAWMSDVTEV